MKFFVPGQTVAKGSTRAFLHPRTNKVITRQSNAKKLYPWQETIGFHAKNAGVKVSDSGLLVMLKFYIKKPQKPKHTFPSRPDLDKLVRAALDGLTGIAYRDDSQVQALVATKEYEDVRGVGVEIIIT